MSARRILLGGYLKLKLATHREDTTRRGVRRRVCLATADHPTGTEIPLCKESSSREQRPRIHVGKVCSKGGRPSRSESSGRDVYFTPSEAKSIRLIIKYSSSRAYI
jgi:hypothetical protein